MPGPGSILCLDGNDNLAEWEIEIYGGIDAYPRYVPWISVGISTRKPLSVPSQYAQVLK